MIHERDHAPLSDLEYAELVGAHPRDGLRRGAPGSRVLFISKGDPALLDQPSLTTAHFPQNGAGAYAGHHPRDSAEATMELERLRRARGRISGHPGDDPLVARLLRAIRRTPGRSLRVPRRHVGRLLIYGLGRLGQTRGRRPRPNGRVRRSIRYGTTWTGCSRPTAA